MHLLPYTLRRLLHRPTHARRGTPEAAKIPERREDDLRRYRPRPSAPAPREAEQEQD